jgi:long-chain acyl-CoA synthetase
MIQDYRLFDFFDNQKDYFSNDKAINFKQNGQWKYYSSKDLKTESDNYALGFLAEGIQPGDKIAIISGNRPEWNFCDGGIQKVGAINVPIYPTSSLSDFKYILNDSEVKIVIVSDITLYEKIKSIQSEVPSLLGIYAFDRLLDIPHVSQLISKGDQANLSQIEDIKSKIKASDLATIIYTSGTTGSPKGVMLSHRNITFNVERAKEFIPINSSQKVLSFLPLCHIFERVATYFYISIGVSLYYAESIDALKENIIDVKPHFFTCVPRLLEKIHSGMLAKAGELSGIKKLLYLWAIKVANSPDAESYWAFGLLDKLIYSKWREALGNNIVGIVTGAAALQPRLDSFFNNIGIRVREAYGMTEASPGVSANLFEKNMSKNGTVGPILKNVEVKLDHREGMEVGDGEILVRGENIMMGYYKNEEATNSTIKDGWLYTGDVGRFVDGKFLKITDRIKELFKTSGGKYVAPQYIENKLKESKYIEQVIVVGNEKKFVAAIIYPNMDNLKSWAEYKKLKIDFKTDAWLTNEWILIKMKKVIDQYNEQFSQIEKVKQFRLINTEWTIDGGQLTPTLKLKRKAIEVNHSTLVEDIYKD